MPHVVTMEGDYSLEFGKKYVRNLIVNQAETIF